MLTLHQLQLYRQLVDFSNKNGTAGTSKDLLPGDACRLTFVYIISSSNTFVKFNSLYYLSNFLVSKNLSQCTHFSLLDSSSTESDVFYVERSSEENSPSRNNIPVVLNSTHTSGAMARETITISAVASLEPDFVTFDSDSNEPTFMNGFGSQHPIVPPRLNDFNLPPNLFKVLATMAVIRADVEYSPQSPEPSIPSPISTPPMNLSTIQGWETPHTTTADATFYTDDEPRRVSCDISSSDTFEPNEPRRVSIASSPSSTPTPPRRQ